MIDIIVFSQVMAFRIHKIRCQHSKITLIKNVSTTCQNTPRIWSLKLSFKREHLICTEEIWKIILSYGSDCGHGKFRPLVCKYQRRWGKRNTPPSLLLSTSPTYTVMKQTTNCIYTCQMLDPVITPVVRISGCGSLIFFNSDILSVCGPHTMWYTPKVFVTGHNISPHMCQALINILAADSSS